MTAMSNSLTPASEQPSGAGMEKMSTPTTPVTEEGVRAFFNGLAALHRTMERGAPGQAAVAITPSLLGLLEQFCSKDERYSRVIANVFIVDYAVIKRNMLLG